uniref:Uncharacterized protein n=1 Tax=Kalanchoe fedtschenkoi TaxID=63787 RepID=A0A7N0TJZ0_KALFE
MDPNLRNFPILSYVMSKLPSFGAPKSAAEEFDIERPPASSTSPRPDVVIESQMPRLTDPKLLQQLTLAISEVAQTRSMLQTLGDRPDHESVDKAKEKVADIEAGMEKKLEELAMAKRPEDVDLLQWKAHVAERESEIRKKAEEERQLYKSIVMLDEMHEAYAKLLKESEEKLVKIYDAHSGDGDAAVEGEKEVEMVSEEVVEVLQEAAGKEMERVDLSGKQLRVLPEAFGKIRGLVMLNLSNNQLQMIPDSIAGLETLEELNLSSNQLESLPDSIGLLQKLKILNVSANLLTSLPDSISHCRALVELDASYNKLTYLPTNIGYELVNLIRLSVPMNKIRSLPSSICEMKSLRILDVHFNELRGLPFAIGKLSNLETLNLSSNFNDLTELPETFGDLMNLRELDLSNNQIHALPDTFGRLESLNKLNLDQNPIVTPPQDIVKQGVEAVKSFMARRWVDLLVEEERKSMNAMREQTQTGWLNRSASWLSNVATGVTESVSEYLSPRAPKDSLLDRQL